MFLTITIDMHAKKRSKFRVLKSNIHTTAGCYKKIKIKPRSLWQKFQEWKRTLGNHAYKRDGQIAMF